MQSEPAFTHVPLNVSSLGKVFDNDALLSIINGFTHSFRVLNILARTSKQLNEQMTRNPDTRTTWINLAATMTALPSKGFIPEEISKKLKGIKGRKPFFDYIRTLICPWTSTPVSCMDKRGPLGKQIPGSRYMLVSESGDRLVFQSYQPVGWQLSAPLEWSENWEESVIKEKFTPLEERTYLESHQHHFELEIQGKLSQPLDMYRFTNGNVMGDNPQFRYFHVHGGAFAVIAHYSDRRIDPIEATSGVYYFAYDECRMLAHQTIHWSTSAYNNAIQSRPGKLWLLTEDWLLHYQCDPLRDEEEVEEGRITLSERVEQMDPCLFMASQGNTKGVLQFIDLQMKGMSINTQTIFNKRTILHYAARNGMVETVYALLERDADPFVPDFSGATPLQLAVRGLHHETVRSLVEKFTKGGPDEERKLPRKFFTGAWREFSNFSSLRRYIPSGVPEVREQCRVAIPSILKTLLLNRGDGGFPEMSEQTLVTCLESKTVLCSAEAVLFIFHMGGENVRKRYLNQGIFRLLFGGFLSPEHEKEAIKTLIMTVDEFQMDVNFSSGITGETHLIWAIRNGTLEAVKTLIEDLHADISVRNNMGNSILCEAKQTESPEIYDYIYSVVHSGSLRPNP